QPPPPQPTPTRYRSPRTPVTSIPANHSAPETGSRTRAGPGEDGNPDPASTRPIPGRTHPAIRQPGRTHLTTDAEHRPHSSSTASRSYNLRRAHPARPPTNRRTGFSDSAPPTKRRTNCSISASTPLSRYRDKPPPSAAATLRTASLEVMK